MTAKVPYLKCHTSKVTGTSQTREQRVLPPFSINAPDLAGVNETEKEIAATPLRNNDWNGTRTRIEQAEAIAERIAYSVRR